MSKRRLTRSEISSMGGAAVKAENRSFSRNRELARNAGQLGGMNVPAKNRSFSKNRELARMAGIKGAKRRKENQHKRKKPIQTPSTDV